jgi:hypothetical protein
MAGGAGVALLMIVLIVVLATRGSRAPVAAQHAAPPTANIVRRPADGKIKVSVESMPAGADVFVEGSSEPVGQTPTSFPLAFDEHIPTRLIVRKAGYDDYVAEVVPARDQPIIAGLRPKTAGPPATASAAKAASSSPPRARTSAVPKKRRSRLDRGGLVDPF